MRWSLASLALALVLVGCGAPSGGGPVAQKAPVVAPFVDPWVLGTLDPRAEEPALLWNGLIGVRIARNGGGVPNAFFAIDAYQPDGEEKILPLPNPIPAAESLRVDFAKPYSQKLDMRTGVLTTEMSLEGGGTAKQEVVMHPDARMLAVRWTFTGTSAVATPMKLDQAALGMNFQVRSAPGEETVAFGDRKGSPAPNPLSFDEIAALAAKTWRKRWETDIEIDGPVADQQAVRSFMFYLRSAIHPKGGMSISPYALSSTKYNGHVFWDADIWVMPSLAFLDPKAAAAIVDYRYRRLGQAELNATEWAKAGRPNANGDLGPVKGPLGAAAKFPWESSVSGKETAPASSKFEDHITGSVAHAAEVASMAGIVDEREAEKIRSGAYFFYKNRITKRPDGLYGLTGTMSPDENHTGDNDLYTNVLAQGLIDRYGSKNRPKLALPKDETSFLTYDDDLLRGYKQAAAVLSIYPLQYPPAEKQAKVMMDRFADKTIENGPAMSDSVHALIWARLGETQKAYATWHESWQPFTNHPLMLFTEKRRRSEAYFTTGAGGALQTVLFGFLGMRLDYKQEPGSAWSTKTFGGSTLSIKPNLPAEWKSVKLRNFTVGGKRFTLEASSSAVRVVPGG